MSFEKKFIYEHFFQKLSAGGKNSYVKRGFVERGGAQDLF
jgi:hypothetical protein